MSEYVNESNRTLKDRVKEALKEFGLPRMIIAAFLLLMFIVAPFTGANFWTQITNVINRFSWNAVLVLAMVPMVHSGCGLNFGLPVGIIAGLLGATLSIEWGFTGPLSFVMAIVIATPFDDDRHLRGLFGGVLLLHDVAGAALQEAGHGLGL